MHWGSIKIPCLRLTQGHVQRRGIKGPKRYFKVYALRVWVFFLTEYGRLYVGKSDCEYEQIIIYFCFFSHRQFENFLLNAFIFLMELHFVHNYHIQVEQYRLFCSYLFDFVLFSALLFYNDTMYVFLTKYKLALIRRIQMRGHHLISCCWEWRSWWRRTFLTWI